ncbi:MAG: hypothetical protein JNL38_07890 [Myxococcales bacterium]|jgi:hypothetical protein|nr:hypothetical protein [Myxococcales bacterium]
MRKLLGCLALTAALLAPGVARAEEVVIDKPNDHPSYRLELEPRAILWFGRINREGTAHVGAGLRANFVLADPLIKSFNNNLAVGTGVDFFSYHGGLTAFVPVVLQWNFFLLEHLSLFPEIGLGLGVGAYHDAYLAPLLALGGRIHIVERVALTLRVGYPGLGIGLSFFL